MNLGFSYWDVDSCVVNKGEWLFLEFETFLRIDANTLAGVHVLIRHFILNLVIKLRER